MQRNQHSPVSALARPGAVTVLEAGPGPVRDLLIDQWLNRATKAGSETWRLDCAPETGGLWAGLAHLIGSVVESMELVAPDLVADYGYELTLLLPRLDGCLQVARPLTETTAPGERTRNYPADRIDRSLQGVVELLASWHERTGSRPWAMACVNFDRANRLVRRFFYELMRRRGQGMGLQFLICSAPDQSAEIAGRFEEFVPTVLVRPEGDDPAEQAPDPVEMTARATALETVLRRDPYAQYTDLPRLIHCWKKSTDPQRAINWQIVAINAFNHRGLYSASLEYADDVEVGLDSIAAEDPERYLAAVNGLYFCRVTLGDPERARAVTEQAIGRIEASEVPHMFYLLAMLHARFLDRHNLEKAEQYLDRALSLMAEVDVAEEDRQFMTVFLMNGMALIRVRQHRPAEAIALCEAGLGRLRQHLAPGRHQLHHSVLLYNIAQVYAQTGPDDLALEYFRQTMEMDPNYSEYYNDRGAIYQKLGRLEEAEADFLEAIRLSPPYPEVWVNLGQCYRAMGRMSDAVRAYSRALDLDPTSDLAWAGRAEARAALGHHDWALADYDEALRLDPSQADVWGARAVVYYEMGRLVDALDDLDRAVDLAPGHGELRQNRAVARRDLGLNSYAAADLQTYLALCPTAEDGDDVRQEIASLLVAVEG